MAVVVVNYASHELLSRNLGGVADPGLVVVVVDNYSSAAERRALCGLAEQHRWSVVLPPENMGFGAGVNLGVARAIEIGCSAVVLLNPDALAPTEVLIELGQRVLSHPRAMIAPRICTSAGANYFRGSRLLLRSGRLRGLRDGESGVVRSTADSVPWLTAACLAIGVELFEQLGGFRDDYFLYWEDVDLSYRAVAAGAELIVATDLLVQHDEGGTQQPTGGRAKSDAYYYFNTRNRLLFAVHNLDRRAVLRWLLRTPSESWQILLRGGRRGLVQSSGPLRSAIRGSLGGAMFAFRELASRHRRPHR